MGLGCEQAGTRMPLDNNETKHATYHEPHTRPRLHKPPTTHSWALDAPPGILASPTHTCSNPVYQPALMETVLGAHPLSLICAATTSQQTPAPCLRLSWHALE